MTAATAGIGTVRAGTVVVLANVASGADGTGGADRVGAIRAALEAAGVRAEVRAVTGGGIAAAARDAASAGATVVVAAGGDGTVSAVASAVAGADGVTLGVLPMGTLNHFARDLGIPTDLAGAAAVIAEAYAKAVDVGEVKGRCFINNASIGIYPTMVRRRDEIRERLGRGKVPAMVAAALSVFRRHPMVHLRIDAGDQCVEQHTPFAFVGNNDYEISLLSLGRRSAVDRGQLCLYYTRRTGRWGLVWLVLRALVGRLKQDRDFEAVCLGQVYMDSRRSKLLLGIDGELVEVAPPLLFRSRPGALRVIVPRPVVETREEDTAGQAGGGTRGGQDVEAGEKEEGGR